MAMSTTPTDKRRAALRDAYERERGRWSASLDGLLEHDPDYLERVLRFTGHPWRNGTLEPKVRELVLLAVDAAATHRHADGAREHAQAALDHGATPDEIVEVLQLTSTMGIHACNCGVPILLEELAAAGQPVDLAAPLTARQEEIKAEFTEKRGYWNAFWDGLLHLDAEFFAAYTAMSSHPWEHGPLEPKVKELIYTAFDVSATHMFEPGLRQHIRNALGYGATAGEIMEVIELASGIGVEAFAIALPALGDDGDRGREGA
jgi:alkylhydroperoxidase/carboxymuconolactone decarboxylase family protein YurZ